MPPKKCGLESRHVVTKRKLDIALKRFTAVFMRRLTKGMRKVITDKGLSGECCNFCHILAKYSLLYNEMRIIGIDPGYAIVGFGILEYQNATFKVIDYGAITTKSTTPFPTRLCEIYDDLCQILDKYKPEYCSLEKLYFDTNQKTVIEVGEARGVIVLPLAQRGIIIEEYTPLQVKSAVTGYGKAVKKQVQEMTRQILKLTEIPKPDDAADALAMAICLAHSSLSKRLADKRD